MWGMFGVVVEWGMIKSGCDVVGVEEVGNVFGVFGVGGIENWGGVEGLDEKKGGVGDCGLWGLRGG